MKASSINLQAPKKRQASSTNRRLGAWNLEFLWSLDVGAWCFFLPLSLAVLLPLTGCVTKASAKAREREAFVAGQQQALARMPQTQPQGPIVTVIGPVRNGVIPWTEELTVAKAIIAAGYLGKADPREIALVRSGRAITINPKELLGGQDIAVLPGDILQLMP